MATHSSFDKLAPWHDDAPYSLFSKDLDPRTCGERSQSFSGKGSVKRPAQFTSTLSKVTASLSSLHVIPTCAIPESLIPGWKKMPRAKNEIIEHMFGEFGYSYAHSYSLESYCFER
jgi:hypothetical protein